MNVNTYTYQSPSTQSVQVGRLDPSSKSSDTSGSALESSTNETLKEAQSFNASQTSEVKPKVDTGNTLDIYA